MLQTQDTKLDGVLTVAHAVWHFAGVVLGGRPEERALTRSLCDLTRFAKWARVGAGCLGAFECVEWRPHDRLFLHSHRL